MAFSPARRGRAGSFSPARPFNGALVRASIASGLVWCKLELLGASLELGGASLELREASI